MVLHKNKWDKKASRKHEQKLASKDSKALEEEKHKAALRRAPGGAKTPVVNASVTEDFPRLPSQKKDETAEKTNDQLQDNESKGSGGGDSDDDADGDQSGDIEVTSQRRKRTIQSNAWRYQEPEPEPGAEVESEDSDHEKEYLKLAQGKLQDIEDRETKEEQLNQKIDITSDPNEAKTYKGNVLTASRDDFKDVSEKIRKQKQVEEFRRRFGSPQSNAGRKIKNTEDESNDLSHHEKDLDDILGLI